MSAAAARFWTIGLVTAWAIAFAGGYLGAWLTEPTDIGFTRGLNRFLTWFWSQAIALAFAVAAWVFVRSRRRISSPAARRIGRAPLVVTGLEGLLLAGYIAYAMVTGT